MTVAARRRLPARITRSARRCDWNGIVRKAPPIGSSCSNTTRLSSGQAPTLHLIQEIATGNQKIAVIAFVDNEQQGQAAIRAGATLAPLKGALAQKLFAQFEVLIGEESR